MGSALLRAALALVVSAVALGCNSCDRGTAPSTSASPASPASPGANDEGTLGPKGPETSRPFYALVSKAAAPGSATERARFSSDVGLLPTSGSHPGKRPWTQGEVLDRLDEMAKKAPEGLWAMGLYAWKRAEEPIDNDDPRAAAGGGPESGLRTFNQGANLLLIGRVRELAGSAKSAADVVKLFAEIATIPLPIESNSGGATDGKNQRDRLAAELRAAVPLALWQETEADRKKVTFRNNKEVPPER